MSATDYVSGAWRLTEQMRDGMSAGCGERDISIRTRLLQRMLGRDLARNAIAVA